MTSTIKNLNDQTRKLTKAILSVQSPYLKKIRKNFTLKKKLQRKTIILKNSGKFQSLEVCFLKGRRQSKISLKENDAVSLNSKNNANTFCRFFSNLVDSLLWKFPRPKNKFGIQTTEEHYKQIRSECENFVLHNVDVTTVDKILKSLDVAKASEID